jgi:acetolactate synthase regulatory subunit
MPFAIIYRIYTEDKNRTRILRLASAHFDSFTVQPIDGYYQGKRERSIVVEIATASPRQIEELARQIRRMNGQKSVLILRSRAILKVTRR